MAKWRDRKTEREEKEEEEGSNRKEAGGRGSKLGATQPGTKRVRHVSIQVNTCARI